MPRTITPAAEDLQLSISVPAGTVVVLSEVAGKRALNLGLAERWVLTLECVSGPGISLVRYRRRGNATWPWSTDWIDAEGVVLGSTGVGEIRVVGDCSRQLDIELTAAAGVAPSIVNLYLLGA